MHKHLAAAALAAITLSACSGIGDGNAPESMRILVNGVENDAELFECFVNTPQLAVSFNDGQAADFLSRARWSSSDESVVKIGDGVTSFAEGTFRNGVLLPVGEGTATITAEYLNFVSTIDVSVSPMTIEVGPVEQTLMQGTAGSLQAVAVIEGQTRNRSSSLVGAGTWRVEPAAGDETVTTINAGSGLIRAKTGVAGTDNAIFRIDFCDSETEVPVQVFNNTLQRLEFEDANNPGTVLDAVELPPDTSLALAVYGVFDNGKRQLLTTSVAYAIDDTSVANVGVRGFGVVNTGVRDAETGDAETTLTVTFDPDSEVDGDEIASDPLPIRYLQLPLDSESLVIAPSEVTLLPGIGQQFTAEGTFTDGERSLTRPLTRDVLWTSGDTDLLTINSFTGVRGFAFAPNTARGEVIVAATRLSGDGPEDVPFATVIVGSDVEDDELQLSNLSVAGDASVARGEVAMLTAWADMTSANGTTAQDVTRAVIWRSSDPSIAVVSNLIGEKGLVRAVTDAADQVVVLQARYRDHQVVEGELVAEFTMTVNPSP